MKEQSDELLKVTIARRSVWHFMRTVLIAVLVILLCIGVFFTAMYISNLYILTTEGLVLRAGCILQEGSLLEMSEYFTQYFIESDSLLYEGIYDNYTVTGFDYRFDILGISVWPWSTEATMDVAEHMNSISGSINSDAIPPDAPEGASYPLPEWNESQYRIHYLRLNGRWYISEMEYLGETPPLVSKATPVPTAVSE